MIEVALVARVGHRRAPIILAVLRDQDMLTDALRRALVAAAAERVLHEAGQPDVLSSPGGHAPGLVM